MITKVLIGLILPLSLSLAIFRLSTEEFLFFQDLELEYFSVLPHLCYLLSYLDITWFTIIGSSTLISVIFRLDSIMYSFCSIWVWSCQYFRHTLVKYSNRGLADDVLWFNGGLKLFEKLFWISNLTLICIPQMAWLVRLLQDGPNYSPHPHIDR